MSDPIPSNPHETPNPAPEWSAGDALRLLLLLGFALGVMAYAWVGHTGSDDMMYVGGAVAWLEEFPFVGDTHWELRHPIVMPMAVSIAVFGYHELAFFGPLAAYGLAMVAVLFLGMRRTFGRGPATLAAVLLAATPLFAINSTRGVSDVCEVFFLTSSLWLFWFATRSGTPARLLFAAGLAAGLACVTRETAGLIVLLYGVLFLLGRGVPRRRFLALAAGLALVLGADTAYLWVQTGDPLYRVVTDLGTHLDVDLYDGDVVGEVSGTRQAPQGRREKMGNLAVGKLVDPALVLFVNQEFGLTWYLALPFLVWLYRTRRLPESARGAARLIGTLGGAWLVYLWFFRFGMSLDPRYFLLPTYVAVIAIGAGATTVLWPRRKVVAVLLVGGLLATDAVGIALDNSDPDWGERRLRDWLVESEGVVHTDPKTANRGVILFRVAGVEERVSFEPPTSGDVYFANPRNLTMLWAPPGISRKEYRAQYRPAEDWEVLEVFEPEPTLLARALAAVGLDGVLPARVWRRLARPHETMTVYRVP